MRVLISGAGIAGPTLAYWLARYGMTPTMVEKAPALRTGGYVIDFWGAGFEIAERMGLLPQIRRTGYVVQEVRVVNDNGRRVAGFPAAAFTRATNSRYVSVPRGDLAAAIFHSLDGVETIFGDGIARVEQHADSVQVSFDSGSTRQFDLLIGADGLHSRVRELVHGPEPRFERYLGYKVAAFEAIGYRPRDELVYVMFTEVGQQVGRFTMRDDRTMFLFIFAADDDGRGDGNIEAQKALLRRRFGDSGWECPRILERLDDVDDLYFDRVSQIRMGSAPGAWSRGRVTLVGDAASCVSLLAGQGSALAMTAAYILAGELHRAGGDWATAFARYEARFGSFVLQKQGTALRFAGSFAPESKVSMFLRNQIMNLLRIQWVANMAVGRDMIDRIELPDY